LARSLPSRISGLVLCNPSYPGIGDRRLAYAAQSQFWYQHFHSTTIADAVIGYNRETVRLYLSHFYDHLIGARQPDQLQANLAALDLILTDAQIAKLNEASKPALNFPADINTHLAPMFGFPGTTIDGQTAPASPLLAASTSRY
jgi:hypothetical protein